MSSYAETQAPLEQQTVGVWSGLIVAPATDLAAKVTVTIPDLDPDLAFGPCRWQARDETSLPDRGDRCLVAFDQAGEPYVVLWWPFDS